MRFLSLFLSVLALSGSVSAISSENSRSTVNNAGGYVHADASLEAGQYEPHAHRMATMAEPGKPLFKYDPFDLAAGPSNWGNLPDSATCGVTSQKQSPVQLPAIWDMKGITKDTTGMLKPLAPSYGTLSGLKIVNTGHALQVDMPPAPNGLTLSGGALGANPYDVIQMHMHGRSEHAVAGAHYPLEIHIVHKDPKLADTDPRKIAVLGIMVQESPDGRDNPALTPLTSVVFNANFSSPINKEGISMALNMPLSLTNLLPQLNKDYYHYSGSLTTPPCSEQVVWHVLTTPIMASRTQILALTAPFGTVGNSRPTQALNGRPVYLTWFQTQPLGTGSASTVSMTLAGIVSVIMTLIQMQ